MMQAFEDFQVGDLIRSYYNLGFHKVTKVKSYPDDPDSTRIDYVHVMQDDGRLSTTNARGHAHHQLCTIVDEDEINNIINEESMRLELKRANLLNLMRKP
jgi:hypothetical protein